MVEDAISFWTDIKRYEDMLAADPTSYCFAPLSELYRKLGLLDDAISVALKGCGQHPDYPGGFFALGSAYYDKGMKAEAKQALERVVSLKPGYLQALRLLGQVLVEMGEIDQARQALGEILKHDPDDTESVLLLRSIGTGRTAQAEEPALEEADLVEDLTEEVEDGGQVHVAHALADYDWVGSPSAAKVPQAPKEPAPYEEPEDLWAIEDFEGLEEPQATAEAAPAKPAAPPGRDPLTTATLAELYVSQGFIEKALAVYQELLSVDPANQSFRSRYEELKGSLQRSEEPQAAAEEPAAVQAPAPATPAEPAPAVPAEPAPAVPAEPAASEAPFFEEPAASEPFFSDEPAASAPEEIAAFEPSFEEAAAPEPFSFEEAAAPEPVPAAQVKGFEEVSTVPQGDLEAQLSHWLQNIRRRRDGV